MGTHDVDTGYDPARIGDLSRRTAHAHDHLGLLTSSDPAAADAVRAIRLTRLNLEDLWFTALRDIERSDAMVTWRSSHLDGWRGRSLAELADLMPEHLRPDGATPADDSTLSDDERAALLGHLDWLDRKAMVGDDGDDDVAGRPTDAELDALAEQLAHWVPRDDELRDRLIELATSNLLIGRLLGHAEFPSSFVATVISTMSSPNGPDTGVDRERYARSLSDAFAAMADDPGGSLDLLLADNGRILYDITAWGDLDTAAISDFVIAGLHTAVVLDPRRLGDGYDALARLTTFTSGALGHGIGAGVALGVATSMVGYLDKLGPAVRFSGPSERVNIIDEPLGIDAAFGSYDDVRGLFGVVLRHPDAQAALGAVTSGWAEATLAATTSLPVYQRQLNTVAKFAGMLSDAADSEQAEMVMEAAATEARSRQIGAVIGFATDAAAGSLGTPGALRKVLSWTVGFGTSLLSRGDAATMPGPRLGAEVRRQMAVTAVTKALGDPGFFDSGNERDRTPPLTSAQRHDVERRLAAVERADGPDEYHHAYDDLMSHIDCYVPALRAAAHVADADPAANDLDDD